jgi:hypothetical protein
MIKIFHNLALFCVKNAIFFRRIFRQKYFKNHNIGPRLGEFSPTGWSFIFDIVLKIDIFGLLFSTVLGVIVNQTFLFKNAFIELKLNVS